MPWVRELLMRMFGRPKGVLGRLGGVIMARVNRDAAAQVIEVLDVRPDDKVLEVGFGPGVAAMGGGTKENFIEMAKRAAQEYLDEHDEEEA
jgi:16S rRNA A1518/A1519 N6-dimethyltransferase RsmA/KsgA/DIM1 with predicted DNA glycosylase/AP lyase activity